MVKRRKAKKARKTKRVKRAPKKRTKRKSALMQLTYTVSPELQEIVGGRTMTRPQVVKKLWVYIKAHHCQDKHKRRIIVPDHKLSRVLGSRPIDMLKMSSALSKHLKR